MRARPVALAIGSVALVASAFLLTGSRPRVEPFDRILERLSVDVRQETHVQLRLARAQSIDQQRRSEQRSADPDVQDSGHRSERTRLDRIDERSRALAASGGEIDILWCAASTLGYVGRRPAFAGIDDVAREQGIAPRGETHRFDAADEPVDQRLVEMCLRPVEIETCDLEAQAPEPVRLGGEQLIQPLHFILLLFGRHCGTAHNQRAA